MMQRIALTLVALCVLVGCVRSGAAEDPMSTSEGRKAARDAYIQLGIGHLQHGSSEKAKEPLREALRLDSASAEAHAVLALVYQQEMEPELADQHYRKAISLGQGDARLLNNYGGFLFEQGRYADAWAQYLKAAEDPMYGERSRVFENLGLTAQKLGKTDEAEHYFERALRLNSGRLIALLQMAQLSLAKKDYVAARHYYGNYSNQSGQTAESLLLGIRLARVFEDRDQAASLGLQLKRLYPGTPEYQKYLSEQ